MAYCLEQPTDTSQFNYIEITEEELTVLNVIEDNLLAPGMVVTLDDLYAHRARLTAINEAATTRPANAPQDTAQSASKAVPPATKERRSQGLTAALKQFLNRK